MGFDLFHRAYRPVCLIYENYFFYFIPEHDSGLEALQLGLQELACKVNAALYGTQRFLEHFGYLVIFESIEIKQERVAEDLRQLMDSGLNIFDPQVAFYRSRGCHLGRVQKEFVGGTVKDGVLFGLSAVIIDEDIFPKFFYT